MQIGQKKIVLSKDSDVMSLVYACTCVLSLEFSCPRCRFYELILVLKRHNVKFRSNGSGSHARHFACPFLPLSPFGFVLELSKKLHKFWSFP